MSRHFLVDGVVFGEEDMQGLGRVPVAVRRRFLSNRLVEDVEKGVVEGGLLDRFANVTGPIRVFNGRGRRSRAK